MNFNSEVIQRSQQPSGYPLGLVECPVNILGIQQYVHTFMHTYEQFGLNESRDDIWPISICNKIHYRNES
jgi:hypothetical protein